MWFITPRILSRFSTQSLIEGFNESVASWNFANFQVSKLYLADSKVDHVSRRGSCEISTLQDMERNLVEGFIEKVSRAREIYREIFKFSSFKILRSGDRKPCWDVVHPSQDWLVSRDKLHKFRWFCVVEFYEAVSTFGVEKFAKKPVNITENRLTII